jgi:hypothetical protein
MILLISVSGVAEATAPGLQYFLAENKPDLPNSETFSNFVS